MVESLKDLNKIVQKPRYREVGNWMVRNILRDAALPVTWLLLHTPITANQVTFLSLGVALFGIFLLSLEGAGAFLAGTLCLQFWYYLDHVDGQIARYRGTASLTGRFFDFLTHHIVHGVLFFSLGLHAYDATHQFFFVIWGFLGSASMFLFNVLYDTKYKTFMEKLSSYDRVQVLKSSSATQTGKEQGSERGLKKLFSVFHKLCEIHVLMNILTLGAILEALFKFPWDARVLLFVAYGIGVPLLVSLKAFCWIKERRIDADFETSFRALSSE